MGANGEGTQSDSVYINRIKELNELKTYSDDDSDRLRKTYAYLVVGILAAYETTDKLDVPTLQATAYEKANRMITEHPYQFAKPEGVDKLDNDGNAKPKKGAKKELAMQVYAEFIKDKVVARQEAIAILVDKVGMTPAGASTYFANLKKHNGVL